MKKETYIERLAYIILEAGKAKIYKVDRTNKVCVCVGLTDKDFKAVMIKMLQLKIVNMLKKKEKVALAKK